MNAITEFLNVVWKSATSETATNILLVLAIPLIGLLDGLGEGKIRLNAFFLIPIMLITWRMGRRAGIFATIAALVILLIVSAVDKPLGTSSILFSIDAIGRFVSFFIIVAILSALRSSYMIQKTNAIKDPLTLLYNRLGLREILIVELENARRGGHPFLLLFLDCDNFKAVNDRWGHGTGDHLLQTVADTIVGSIRRSDFASRVGG
ncbi:MAG TPA: diguanylate cyclase, partial [Methylobacter sp.]